MIVLLSTANPSPPAPTASATSCPATNPPQTEAADLPLLPSGVTA